MICIVIYALNLYIFYQLVFRRTIGLFDNKRLTFKKRSFQFACSHCLKSQNKHESLKIKYETMN